MSDDDEREFHVEFTIDGIWAAGPREAAQIVADMLSPNTDGYAHAAVYEVSATAVEGDATTTVDLSDPDL
jgi:hypothetical protein